MKKLMTALTICAVAGFAVAADVVSENIVGFQKIAATGKYFTSGATFISVGDPNGEWLLGDITVTGMNAYTDFIQFLGTSNAKTVLSATYVDAAWDTANGDGDGALIGWWDPNDIGNTSLDNTVISAGTGFLCNLTSVGVVFNYAGEVLQGTNTLDLSGLKYPLVANFTPVDLKLGDLTVAGMNAYTDFIQFLGTSNAKTVLSATYVDAAWDTANGDGDGALIGWWDPNDIGNTSLDNVDLPAGASFLCNITISTSPNVKITFPNPVTP